MKIFKKILIANRGEIAVRIIRSAQKLGIRTVAVYAGVDKDALHVQKADESFSLGTGDLSKTYLNIDKIIETAIGSGSDAIHPGYGFLAENADFVKACEKANIVFIGPHAKAISLMGNKIESRKFVSKLDIPMTAGITGSPKTLVTKAKQMTYPILVKAAAGGGGKGMRIVNQPSELEGILESTSREAKNYFGDGTVYIEKYVVEPRHIEFQILGDNHGNVVHLFERECTIQRRYQKIIEESPSPTLTPSVRKKMGDAAVKISKEIGYNSAGTMEFLVDKDLNFYFLEMNTRIQVEHPVTEMVTGIDLVEEQILVAAGNKLRFGQQDIKQNGHAIECRIYAEDPANNFLPQPGKMTLYRQPSGENIRIDSGIDKATEIHSFFDPMIAKLIVWDENRKGATKKSIDALKEFIVHGINTNISYLMSLLKHPAFSGNKLSTKFCDEHTDDILDRIKKEKKSQGNAPAAFAYTLYSINHKPSGNGQNIWQKIGYWRNIMEIPVSIGETTETIAIDKSKGTDYTFTLNGSTHQIQLLDVDTNEIVFMLDGKSQHAYVSTDQKGMGWVTLNGLLYKLLRQDILVEKDEYVFTGNDDLESNLFAPMPGKVIKVNVKAGDKVQRGTVMLVVEAMKMENNITSLTDAVVKKISVKEGDMVDTDVQLVHLEKSDKENKATQK